MNSKKFKIAGLNLALESPYIENAMRWLDGFEVFEVSTGEPDFTFICGSLRLPVGSGTPVHTFEVNERMGRLIRTEKGWDFIINSSQEQPETTVVIDMEARVAYSNITGGRDLLDLKFQVWLALGFVLLEHQIVSIHSSTVVYNGGAVLFLGESGTGKSTHTSLWLKHIADTKLLNDDSPFISVRGGKVVCYGSPWSGKGQCYCNESYPIKALVRLSQGAQNRIKQLDKLNAIGAVYPSCPPSFGYDDNLMDAVFAIISIVVGNVPLYSLECLPDEAAARLSFETIFRDC